MVFSMLNDFVYLGLTRTMTRSDVIAGFPWLDQWEESKMQSLSTLDFI
jgi:hypothetical protein